MNTAEEQFDQYESELDPVKEDTDTQRKKIIILFTIIFLLGILFGLYIRKTNHELDPVEEARIRENVLNEIPEQDLYVPTSEEDEIASVKGDSTSRPQTFAAPVPTQKETIVPTANPTIVPTTVVPTTPSPTPTYPPIPSFEPTPTPVFDESWQLLGIKPYIEALAQFGAIEDESNGDKVLAIRNYLVKQYEQGINLSKINISELINIESIQSEAKTTSDITSGLLAYWEFDESSWSNSPGEVIDSGGNGYNLTPYNGVQTQSTNAKKNNSAAFDGIDDYIATTLPAGLKTTNFSFGVWVNKGTVANSTVLALHPKGASNDGRGYILGVDGSNYPTLSKGSGDGSYESVTSSTAISLSEWTHLAGSFNGSELKIYVNGSLTGTLTNSQPVIWGEKAGTYYPDPGQLFIGGVRTNTTSTTNINANTSFFGGRLDNLKLFDRSFTDSDAQELYLEGLDIVSDLEGHWKMDELSWNGTNGEVIDSSGNGNHGTATGAIIQSGNIGNAGYFDGVNDYIDIPDSSSVDFGTEDFTVSMWAKYPSQNVGSAPDYSLLFSNTHASSSVPFTGINIFATNSGWTGSDRLRFRVDSNNSVISNATGLDDDTWRHYTFVREGNVLKIYINGVLDNQASVSSIDVTTNGVIRLGVNHANNTSQNFFGKLDDVRVYSRGLIAGEVNKLYTSSNIPVLESCPASVQARFQIGATGLHQYGTFSQTAVNDGANFEWAVVMNGDVNQVFGGQVTLSTPNGLVGPYDYANGLDILPTPATTGTYTITAKALNGSTCATASVEVVADPGAGDMLCGDFSVEPTVGGADICSNTDTGIEDVYVRDNNNNIVAKMTVDKDTGRDWQAMKAFSRDKEEFGAGNAAILHYPGGASSIPGIVGSNFTLYVPRDTDDVKVRICPGLEDSSQLTTECEGGVTLPLGTTGQYTVSAVTLESKDYFEITGVTGTGGITIPNGVKDTLTRLEVAQASDHTIQYSTVYGLTASGNSTAVQFDPASQNWDLTGVTIADIDLEDDGVDKTLAAAAGADIWGVNINTTTDTITFTAPTSGTDYIAAGSTIVVKIGAVADSGVNQITNPGTVSTYEVGITNITPSLTETAFTEVPIIDDDTVNVTGYIDTFITFDIDTSEVDEDCDEASGANPCDSHGGSNNNAGYVIDLGELTTSSVNDSGDIVIHQDGLSGEINSIYFDLSTNANGGAAVTVQSLNAGITGTGGTIPTVGNGSEVQITAGSGLYGINSFAGLTLSSLSGGVIKSDDCDGDGGDDYYCDVPTIPVEIFNTAGVPIDTLRMEWEVGVSPDALDGTGTYTDQLTFIATATF